MSNVAFGFTVPMSLGRILTTSFRQGIICLNKGNLTSNVRVGTGNANGPTFTTTGSTITQNNANPASSNWSSVSPLVLRNTGASYLSTPVSSLLVPGLSYGVNSGSFRFYMNTVSTTRSQILLFCGTASTGIAFFIFTNRLLYIQANGVASYQVSASVISPTTWYHIDYRQAATGFLVYVNGTLSLTISGWAPNGVANASDPFALLGNPVNTSLWSDAYMTDVVSSYGTNYLTTAIVPQFTPSIYVNASWK